jgi:hypothetical protein
MATKDFVDYSPASGSNNGSIDITAPRNPQMKPRSTAIAVKGGGISKSVDITQIPGNPAPMSIVNAEGTTGSSGEWTFPAFGGYQIGSKPQVIYTTRETGVLVNDTATIYIGNQKIVKVEANFTNAIEFEVDAAKNAIIVILNNAAIGIVNNLAIYGDGQPDIPWITLGVRVINH